MGLIWHPYTQHKTALPEIELKSAKGAVLTTVDDKEIIDAVSSWWVNPYGHGHPELAEAIYKQILTLDQVIFAGFTHQPALQLAKKLLDITPSNQQKVFFSDNGSTAVEVGLKMAIQYFHNLGKPKCTIIAFEGAYHGDTFGAMATGEKGKFFEPFEAFTFDVQTIIPPTAGNEELSIKQLQTILDQGNPCCLLVEPLVQGAGGMVIHSAAGLNQLFEACHNKGAICIADEVMTGFGRTGKNFACDYLTEKPDIMCFSKCLTGGILPMAITSCTAEIYSAFHSENKDKTLFHGHSYTGNPVGCAAALTSLSILESKEMQGNLKRIDKQHQQFANEISQHPLLSRVQHLGTILALEIDTGEGNNYFSELRQTMYKYFMDRGILLRPLGNVIYIMPPYCISNEQLNTIYRSIKSFLNTIKPAVS